VRGRPLPGRSALRYLILNKPVGVLTTLSDPEGRRTVRDFLPPSPRLFPVGRLDADTSGLLLLTNDGELAHRLMHPRYGVKKVYRARVSQLPTPEQVRRLRTGVTLEPGVRSAPAEVKVLRGREGRAVVEIAVHEGRYHQVRRMCEAVGLDVKALHRSAYGPLRLAKMARGAVRDLTGVEVARLRRESSRPGGVRRPARGASAGAAGPTAETEGGEGGAWSPFRPDRDEERSPFRIQRNAETLPRERGRQRAPGGRHERSLDGRRERGRPPAREGARRERRGPPPSDGGRRERRGPPRRDDERRGSFPARGPGQSPRARGRGDSGGRPRGPAGRPSRPGNRSTFRRGRRSPNR